MCGACAHKIFRTRGFRPDPLVPRDARGDPPGLSHSQDRAAVRNPLLGRMAGQGVAAPHQHLQNKDAGPALDWERPPPPPPPSAPARPTLTQRSWKPTGAAGSQLHARAHTPIGVPGNDEPGGLSWRVTGNSKLSPTPNQPSQAPLHCFIIIFLGARVVILTLGRGPHVPMFGAGGAGERALQAGP